MAEVQRALFANDSLTAQLLLPEILAACAKDPQRQLGTDTIDIPACDVLVNWDRRFNLNSRGAVLFREWLTRYPYNETYLGRELFDVPFNPQNPDNTVRPQKRRYSARQTRRGRRADG